MGLGRGMNCEVVRGWWGKKRKEKRNEEVVRGWWGKKKEKWCMWVVRKKRKKIIIIIINNVIIKFKSKNQNYIPNTIFFKIVISVVKPKLCTKQNFFYNLEFKSKLKFQLQ